MALKEHLLTALDEACAKTMKGESNESLYRDDGIVVAAHWDGTVQVDLKGDAKKGWSEWLRACEDRAHRRTVITDQSVLHPHKLTFCPKS